MANVVLWKNCLLCRQGNVRGISIHGRLICKDCERLLVTLTCGDPAYESLRLGLKKIPHPWYPGMAPPGGSVRVARNPGTW